MYLLRAVLLYFLLAIFLTAKWRHNQLFLIKIHQELWPCVDHSQVSFQVIFSSIILRKVGKSFSNTLCLLELLTYRTDSGELSLEEL